MKGLLKIQVHYIKLINITEEIWISFTHIILTLTYGTLFTFCLPIFSFLSYLPIQSEQNLTKIRVNCLQFSEHSQIHRYSSISKYTVSQNLQIIKVNSHKRLLSSLKITYFFIWWTDTLLNEDCVGPRKMASLSLLWDILKNIDIRI